MDSSSSEEQEKQGNSAILALLIRDSSKPSTSKIVPEDRIPPTYCFVCGDFTNAYHYEAPSCHGCRSFFRRTILNQKNYACKKEGDCFSQLPTVKRCSCKACRLKKCIDVGMNPMAIQGDIDLEKNALIKRIIKRKESGSASPELDKQIVNLYVPTVDQQINNLVDSLLYLEIKKDRLRKSAHNPNVWELPPLKEILKSSSALGIADKVEPMPNWPLKELPCPPQGRPAGRPDGPPPYNPNRKDWLPYDLLCCVEYAKTFPFFHLLSEKDQLLLLKTVTIMTFMLTQAWFSYENKSDIVIHPDGSGLRPPPGLLDPTHQDLVRMKKQTILPLFRSQLTKKEYVLLKAILLCNTGISDLSDHATRLLAMERQRHSEALLKVCLVEGGNNGPARYSAILAMVDNLERLAEQQRGIHLLMKITFGHRKEVPMPCPSAVCSRVFMVDEAASADEHFKREHGCLELVACALCGVELRTAATLKRHHRARVCRKAAELRESDPSETETDRDDSGSTTDYSSDSSARRNSKLQEYAAF